MALGVVLILNLDFVSGGVVLNLDLLGSALDGCGGCVVFSVLFIGALSPCCCSWLQDLIDLVSVYTQIRTQEQYNMHVF